MTFELHIWGPAFGLPSIDAECIAAVAFFNQITEPDSWVLIAGHDSSCSPTGDFPALYHGSQWIGGFSAIVEYMGGLGHSIDELRREQVADAKAIKTHLITNAQPLIDAVYYTSSVNYTAATRPAWSKILPRYGRFTVPPQKLAAAKSRTGPLGLASDFVDDVNTSNLNPQEQQEARLLSSSPSLIFKKRQTLQNALKTQQSRDLFRLESLIEDVMDPLAQFLGDNPVLLQSNGQTRGASPSSIDCLAVGYLSLLFNTDLENSWVSETIRKRYTALVVYTDRMKAELLPSRALQASKSVRNAPETGPPAECQYPLPWGLPRATAPVKNFHSAIRPMLISLINPVQQQLLFSSGLLQNSRSTTLRSWTAPTTLAVTLAGPVVAVLSYLTYVATHSNLEVNKRFSNRQLSRLTDFGNAGQLLSILGRT